MLWDGEALCKGLKFFGFEYILLDKQSCIYYIYCARKFIVLKRLKKIDFKERYGRKK